MMIFELLNISSITLWKVIISNKLFLLQLHTLDVPVYVNVYGSKYTEQSTGYSPAEKFRSVNWFL